MDMLGMDGDGIEDVARVADGSDVMLVDLGDEVFVDGQRNIECLRGVCAMGLKR